MKTSTKLWMVFALILLTFGQQTPVTAAPTEIEKFVGTSVEAGFSSYDPSGCIHTTSWVWFVEEYSTISVGITQYDDCTFTYLLDAWGHADLADTDFWVSGNLDSATLERTITVYDRIQDVSFDVAIDLAWTATSDLAHGVRNFRDRFPGCQEMEKDNSRGRWAQAVGTISAGVENFAPEPSITGAIRFEKATVIYACSAEMLTNVHQQIVGMIGDLRSYKSSSATAGAEAVDPSGCIHTTVWFTASNVNIGPGRDNASFLDLNVFRYDECANRVVIWAYGKTDLGEGEFKTSGNQATLHTTVTAYDPERNQSLEGITLDLKWIASGPLYQSSYSFAQHEANCQAHGHETWSQRATQASGLISIPDANFAQAPWQYTDMQWDKYIIDACY